MAAFECKWKQEKIKIPVGFAKAYPDAGFTGITSSNYLAFIT